MPIKPDQYWKVKAKPLPGSKLVVARSAFNKFFTKTFSGSKRKPYIRSKFFGKRKVFVHLFREHTYQKHRQEQIRRLKLFPAALDLIIHSTCKPLSKSHQTKSYLMLHRFYGRFSNGKAFAVQISENKKRSELFFLSVFEIKKPLAV